jgi:hypothetical protein
MPGALWLRTIKRDQWPGCSGCDLASAMPAVPLARGHQRAGVCGPPRRVEDRGHLVQILSKFSTVYDLLGYPYPVGRGPWLMSIIFLLRLALWAMGLVLGSLGVFFAVVSFSVPAVSGHALVLLGAALGINYFLDG